MPAPPLSLQVRTEAPPVTWATRLHFAWMAAWGGLWTAVLGTGVVVHSSVRPGPATFSRWMRTWGWLVLRGSGIRFHVEDRAPGGRREPVLYVVNHQNLLDVAAVSISLPTDHAYVARHDLRSWPIIGWVLERTACRFIDRSSPRRAIDSLRENADRIQAGENYVLFPEGGRSFGHALAPFGRGAFLLAIEAGVPVVPVALVGNAGVLDERRRVSRPGDVRIVIGAPLATAGLRRADAAGLADQARAFIAGEIERSALAPASGAPSASARPVGVLGTRAPST